MAYVFLSHSHSDKPFARRLAADLRRSGHSVWIDEAEINIGDSLITKIRSGLDRVDFVAAILSETSLQSEWVQRELEIASNREIDERRVVVLPLLVEDVELPGFLKGKLYGDFRRAEAYDDSLSRLVRALGPATAPPSPDADEIALLKAELEAVRGFAARATAAEKRAGEAAFEAKSSELKEAIARAEERFPQHSPINRTYAFEVGGMPVTLDYALWAISKEIRKGAHPLSAMLTLFDRWSDLERMLEAYDDMVSI